MDSGKRSPLGRPAMTLASVDFPLPVRPIRMTTRSGFSEGCGSGSFSSPETSVSSQECDIVSAVESSRSLFVMDCSGVSSQHSSRDRAGPGPKLNPLDLMNGYLNFAVVN